ncbi:PQQ-dependent sugar dehydrogenase [Kineococcus sp. NUM-3379]
MSASTRANPRRPAGLLPAAGTALVLAGAVLVAGQLPAAAATGTPVVGVASGRCLDVARGSTAPRAAVIVYRCHGGDNQAWTLTTAGELRVHPAPLCLDVTGAATTSPAAVQTYPCHGGANQRWRVGADESIRGAGSGLCLDVAGGGTADRTPVLVATCTGSVSQRWRRFRPPGDTRPPGVPGNPRVDELTCTSARFSWDAAGDDVGISAYDVYHDGQQMTSVPGTALSVRLTLVPGAVWGLYVNARDPAGNVSQASRTVPVTVPQCGTDTTAPSVPTGLAATASGTTVTLTWDASRDDTGVRGYDVLRDGVRITTLTGSPPPTRFTDAGLAAGTAYSYSVAARDARGNTSAPALARTATTGASCTTAVCGVRQVARDTDVPWGLATLPDGTVLHTRRDAHDVVRLDPATGVRTSVGRVPGVASTDGEGGLMGLAVSPGFAEDRWVYLLHTSPTDNRIVRVRLVGNRLDTASLQVLVQGIRRNKYHNGGRLRFGPDGKLYAATGDAQNGSWAQDVNALEGKVLRLNPDGTVPADNPFGNLVWSYGHRNPQGLAFDSRGRLWEQEFGNSRMDETNLITRGGNYGWPACEGTAGTCGTPGFIAPRRTYSTADGSCSGIAVVRDALYIACARGARMFRAVISGNDLVDLQTWFPGRYGRLRTVEPAPGGLWLTTTNTGDKDSVPDNSDERVLHVTLG